MVHSQSLIQCHRKETMKVVQFTSAYNQHSIYLLLRGLLSSKMKTTEQTTIKKSSQCNFEGQF